ncbi:MAG: glycosyltransferase family 39 protein, partial [Verrucomicrobia bacterium]|nr:glycosyltransferase family 39 protein [Verrucomicrobiota bacterium]
MKENASTVSTGRSSTAIGCGSLILMVFLVYWPSLQGGFIWDDLVLVKRNPLATGELNLRSVWFSGDFWLATVATWGEWLIFGDKPVGYRVVNALLHGTSAILLWRLLLRLQVPGAWLAAVLFAVHPICIASVAWVSELKNTLSLPFYLLSIWAFLQFEAASTQEQIGRGWISYGLSLICFVGALAAKTSTVMLPVVLLICAWWQRGRIVARDGWRLTPHFALALMFGLMTIWFQKHGAIQGVTVQT